MQIKDKRGVFMQIGETIRTYRKKCGLTQEEMARRLGVTAPAVNKWEKGNSLPDVALLAPIARLLGISLDTLLSFREEMTKEEISLLVKELDQRLQTEPYEEVFCRMQEILRTYPTCHQLFWQLALIMDAWRMVKKIPDDGTYEEYFRSCYERALESREENVRISAVGSLYGYHMRNEQYEKAEEYLAYYSERDPERKRKQAEIYSRTGRTEDAYRTNEELLMQLYQTINMTMSNIYLLDIREKDMERAHLMEQKLRGLAALFDMGEYQEWSGGIELAVAEQDVEATLEIAEHLLSGVDQLTCFRHSCLFAHLKWKPLQEEFIKKTRNNLLENFREEEKLGYMKGDQRWQELVKKTEELS